MADKKLKAKHKAKAILRKGGNSKIPKKGKK